jgi:hypothetical protein
MFPLTNPVSVLVVIPAGTLPMTVIQLPGVVPKTRRRWSTKPLSLDEVSVQEITNEPVLPGTTVGLVGSEGGIVLRLACCEMAEETVWPFDVAVALTW